MKEKKGISLIVLIVTIIVMIIIAGAVIISLTETNIIDQAESAVKKHNDAELKSAVGMAYADWIMKEKSTTEPKPVGLQNYIRQSLISQNLIKAEDFSKYYITSTGNIEEVDEEVLTLILEVPEDNKVESLDFTIFDSIYIDWGDDTVAEETQLLWHVYEKKGTYEVKIKGEVNGLEFNRIDIKAIKSWGNTGAETLYIDSINCLEYIAMPHREAFKNLTTVFVQNLENTEVLPDYLFKDCEQLSSVNFDNCPKLREVPPHLFEGCDALTEIKFVNCPLLKNLPAEWQ